MSKKAKKMQTAKTVYDWKPYRGVERCAKTGKYRLASGKIVKTLKPQKR